MIAQDATILSDAGSVVNRFRSRCSEFEHPVERVFALPLRSFRDIFTLETVQLSANQISMCSLT